MMNSLITFKNYSVIHENWLLPATYGGRSRDPEHDISGCNCNIWQTDFGHNFTTIL